MLRPRCSRRDWMEMERRLMLQRWMLGSTMSRRRKITVGLVMAGNRPMRTAVVIHVRMYGMRIRPMDGLSAITMPWNNVLVNSNRSPPSRLWWWWVNRVSYKENLQSQSHEGCNLAGYIRVNKVSGNFHIAPGRSFAINGMHIHDTVHSPRNCGFVNRRPSISVRKMVWQNIIQVILSMTCVSVQKSAKRESEVQTGAIHYEAPKNTPKMVPTSQSFPGMLR